MSYTAYPYLVDLQHLQRLFGSHDAEMAQAIERDNVEWFAYEEVPHPVMRFNLNTRELAHGMSEPPEFLLRQALYEFFAGRVSRPDQAHQYVYAMMLVCAHIGTELPYDQFEALRSGGIAVVGQFDGLQALSELSRTPLPIPALPVPRDEFPTVTYIFPTEAQNLLHARRSGRSQFPFSRRESPQNRAWAIAARRQYDSWLQACAESGQTLIVILH